MTTTFDTKMAAVVLRLLAKFGTTATLVKVTPGRLDALTNTKAPDTSSSQVTKAAPPMDVSQFLSPGGSVRSEALGTIVGTTQTSGTALTAPDVDDRLTIGSTTYRVKRVRPLWSGDDVAAYIVEIQKT